MRTMPLFLLAVIVASFISGCGRSDKFRIMERKTAEETIPLTALVLEFEDVRPFERSFNATLSNIPIIGIKGGFSHDRHDEIYSGSTTPFSEMLPKALVERLSESGTFSKVMYSPRNEMPEAGSYDIIIEGKINELQSRGAIIKYGFSKFADLLWYLGLPSMTRRWVIDVEYKVLDGYTLEPIAQPLDAELETKHTYFTRYYTRAKVKDLKNDIDPIYDELIAHIWEETPSGGDVYWANLREEGQGMLAEARRRQQEIERGAPPVFQFLAPPDESVVRDDSVSLRWRIDAPGGLRSAALASNNQPIDLGLDVLSLSDSATAPKSIPARALSIPLQLGENTLTAQVADHRGNDPQRVSITVTRLPREVRPVERYALLISTQAAGGSESLEDIEAVLSNQMLGQFVDDNVYTRTPASLDASEMEAALRDFASKPLAGNLALVYIRAEGDYEALTIGDGVSLEGFIDDFQRRLATDQVVLLLDIDWSGGPGGPVNERMANLPQRWAVLATTPNGEASSDSVLADAIVEVMEGDGTTRRLTLQRFLDSVQRIINDKMGHESDVFGRYDPDIVMVERE